MLFSKLPRSSRLKTLCTSYKIAQNISTKWLSIRKSIKIWYGATPRDVHSGVGHLFLPFLSASPLGAASFRWLSWTTRRLPVGSCTVAILPATFSGSEGNTKTWGVTGSGMHEILCEIWLLKHVKTLSLLHDSGYE